MNVLDKVIEKYAGVHRRSIIENDVQNIYHKVFDIIEDKIFGNEEIREINYNCKCLNSLIKVNIERRCISVILNTLFNLLFLFLLD